jgi:putative mRNA 3-end processing factor
VSEAGELRAARFSLERRPEGLYLPDLELFLDPSVPVPRAFVSHAHGDHAGALGSPFLVASRETLALAAARAPAPHTDAHAQVTGLAWGETVDLPTAGGTARLMIAPAGHVLGAAQLVIDHPRGRLVYTGDYQAGGGETHGHGAPVACDELIVESTFALPIFRFPDRAQTRQSIVEECRAALAAGDAPVVLAYALGKSQEIIAALLAAELPVVAHGAVHKVSAVYESLGVPQGIADGRVRPYAEEQATKKRAKGEAKEAPSVLVTPPRTRQQPMVKRRKRARVLYVSGWALLDASLERHRADRGFALSDHADHDELIELVRGSGARHVHTVHGDTEILAQILREQGVSASSVESAALDRGEDT